MLNRTNIILTVLLVVQIILSAGLALTSNTHTAPAGEPLLADFSPDAVNEVIIADDLGKEVRLSRSDEGWVLPDADNFPVNGQQVEDVLGKISDFDTSRLIATNPTSHARLEVKDDNFRRKVTLVTDDGNKELYFGTGGGVNTTHTRRADDNHVYLTSGLNSWEIQPQVSSWIDTVYLDVNQDDVTRLVLTNASGTFEFERGEIDWTYLGLGEDEVFNSSRMSSLLRNATTVRMTQPLGLDAQDDYGMDAPEITIDVFYEELIEPAAEATETVDIDDGDAQAPEATAEPAVSEPETVEKSYTIMIGDALGNGEYVLKADNADYYFKVRSSYVTTFRNINHDALLAEPEEATPPPEG